MSTHGDIKIDVGKVIGKTIEFVWKPQCTEHLLMYSRYPPHSSWLAFCYGGVAGGAPQNDFCTLKFSKTIERTIETISYCLKNNCLLSFVPLKFFSSRKPELVPPGVLTVYLWCTEHPQYTHGISKCTQQPPVYSVMYRQCTQ